MSCCLHKNNVSDTFETYHDWNNGILKMWMNRLFHIKMFSFIQNRPPLVIFSACIIVTAVTLFSFAFYIKDVDSIPDSDKNHVSIPIVTFPSISTMPSLLKRYDAFYQLRSGLIFRAPHRLVTYSNSLYSLLFSGMDQFARVFQ